MSVFLSNQRVLAHIEAFVNYVDQTLGSIVSIELSAPLLVVDLLYEFLLVQEFVSRVKRFFKCIFTLRQLFSESSVEHTLTFVFRCCSFLG